MSLVAYDSSGEDSDGEDSSDNGQAVGPKLLKQQSKPETERDDLPCAHNEREQSRDISSHERENDSGKELDDDILERKEEKKPRKSIFSFLPPPSKQKAEDLELSEEDDGMILKQRNKLEKEGFHDKVEKRESTVDKYEANDLKRIKKLSLPEPKRSMEREKQKVKITIPSLPQVSFVYQSVDDASCWEGESVEYTLCKPFGLQVCPDFSSYLLCYFIFILVHRPMSIQSYLLLSNSLVIRLLSMVS